MQRTKLCDGDALKLNIWKLLQECNHRNIWKICDE